MCDCFSNIVIIYNHINFVNSDPHTQNTNLKTSVIESRPVSCFMPKGCFLFLFLLILLILSYQQHISKNYMENTWENLSQVFFFFFVSCCLFERHFCHSLYFLKQKMITSWLRLKHSIEICQTCHNKSLAQYWYCSN